MDGGLAVTKCCWLNVLIFASFLFVQRTVWGIIDVVLLADFIALVALVASGVSVVSVRFGAGIL